MLELMSRLKDGSQNTWNMRWFAVSAHTPPPPNGLKTIVIFGGILGKLGVGWSVNLKIKKNSGLSMLKICFLKCIENEIIIQPICPGQVMLKCFYSQVIYMKLAC